MSLAHLAGLARIHAADGLTVVASHVQVGADRDIEGVVTRLDLPFSITRYGRHERATLGGGIPQIFVFDAGGRQVYEGRGGPDLDRAVERALGPLAAERRLVEAALETGADDALATVALAREMATLDAIGRDSAGALGRRLTELAARFEGHRRADRLTARLDRLAVDPAFARELAAERALRRAVGHLAGLTPCTTCETAPMRENDIARCTGCRRRNQAALDAFGAAARAVAAEHGSTPAARRALEMLERYGLAER